MAITEDASTPAIATGTGAGVLTSATFSPPAGSLLVALVGGGYAPNTGVTTSVAISDSGSHTWTQGPLAHPAQGGTPVSNGGLAGVYYTYLSSAPGSIMVSATYTNLSGGRMLAVRVLNGANSNQSGAGSGTLATLGNAATTGVITFNTTTTGSLVYALFGDSNNNDSFTANGSTSILGTVFSDPTPDFISLVSCKLTSATGTPGSVTVGGTWGANCDSNGAALEILPAAAALPPSTFVRQAVKRSNFY